MRDSRPVIAQQPDDRRNPGGWFPEQKISVEEALRAYTAGVAYAGFQEQEVGILRPGLLADIVLLDRDLFREDPARLGEAKVVKTLVGGRVVYDRQAGPRAGGQGAP